MDIITKTNNSQANILVVDDNLSNLEFLSRMLAKQRYNVRCADSGSLALQVARSGWSQLILLDIKMPDMNGYQVYQQLKAGTRTSEIPVIFLSAVDDVLDQQQAFNVSGTEYITKPFQIKEILLRIENQLTLQSAKIKIYQSNLELEQRVSKRTAELEQANQHLKLEIIERYKIQRELELANHKLAIEIEERQDIQQKLLQIALHDGLTGLSNRLVFFQKLTHVLESSKQNPLHQFVVIFLDCDRFKLINDSLGNLLGDRVLIEIAFRLKSCLNSWDTIARFGGDEFAILIEQIDDPQKGIAIAQEIQAQLSLPFQIEKYKFFCTASIGIVFGNSNYELPEHILRDADTAMYAAKAKGQGQYQLFNPQMQTLALTRLQLETDLRLALKRQELIIYYQPIVDLSNEILVGFEALVRWNHPEQGFIAPGEFIPIAEETGLIIPLGLQVMEQACRQVRIWQQKYSIDQLQISVNLSVKQFYQPDLIEQIDNILHKTELNSHNLKLEITESAIMDNPESVNILLQQFKERQIQLNIDDFGTGYSSLSYLHRFPLDALKIDRSFVSRIGDNGENLEIIQAIVTLAHNLGMTAIAEGIETLQQKTYLKIINCEAGQGYFFAQPLSSDEVELMFHQQIAEKLSHNNSPVLTTDIDTSKINFAIA